MSNKTIKRQQCTIISHVDDLKISHADSNVIQDILTMCNKKFGQESPLVTMRGKVLEQLGMNIYYTVKVEVKISMYDYTDKMLTELPSDTNGMSKTPAESHLFNVNNSADK